MNDECPTDICIGVAIAEDEKDLVDVYERVFKKHDMRICYVAFNGREAVQKYIECTPKPHVVLMDYRMPIVNGIEATKELMRLDPDSRIVFLSADINVKEEALQAGAKAFLKKPVRINDLVTTIKEQYKERGPQHT